MAWIWADRVLDTSVTAGTGALTLSGAPPSGWRTFSTVCSVSDTFYYTIQDPITGAWETGEGTYSAANTVTRTTFRASSTGSAVSFAANAKNVFLDVLGYWFGTTLPATYAALASPTFTGTPNTTKAVAAANTNQIASTTWVQGELANYVSTGVANQNYVKKIGDVMTGKLTTVASQISAAGLTLPHGANPGAGAVNGDVWTQTTGLFGYINGTTVQFAPLASPVFTGNPTGPTPATADSSTTLATTAYVQANLTAEVTVPGGTIAAVAYGDATGTTGVTGVLADFAWDTTNKRLGIGTSAPGSTIDVRGAATISGATVLGSGAPPADVTLYLNKLMTGAATVYGTRSLGVVQSDVTGSAIYNITSAATAASAATTASIIHYYAQQGTFGAGSTVTNQYGFYVHASLVGGATGNYGFYGGIPAGTGDWNIYMAGSASNYMNGGLGIGSTVFSTANGLYVAKTLTGNVSAFAVRNSSTYASDVTTAGYGFYHATATAAATFTLASAYGYRSEQGTIGAGSAITNQFGFYAGSTLVGATNNYGYYSAIPAQTGAWNFYANGSAQNYFAGFTGIGINVPTAAFHVRGADQTAANFDPAGSQAATVYVQGTSSATGGGGAVMLGDSFGPFATIAGYANSGTGPTGDVTVSLRKLGTDTTFTETARFRQAGGMSIAPVAIPAGGTQGVGYLVSSTTNFGTIFGSGAPTASMARGSVYLNSLGTPYVNRDGATNWGQIPSITASIAPPTAPNDNELWYNSDGSAGGGQLYLRFQRRQYDPMGSGEPGGVLGLDPLADSYYGNWCGGVRHDDHPG